MDEVVRRYGFTPKQPGNYICCPFHHEKTPSLKVYAEAGRGWMCFGCGKGGTVIDFAMNLFNIPFLAAVVRLNADFRLGLTNDKTEPVDDRYKYIRAAKEAKEKLDAEQDEYFKHLFGSAPVAADRLARLERIYDVALTTWVSRESQKDKYIYEHPTEHEIKQQKLNAEQETWRAEYLSKAGEYFRLWQAKHFKAPASPEEPLDPEYIEACVKLDALDWWLLVTPFKPPLQTR